MIQDITATILKNEITATIIKNEINVTVTSQGPRGEGIPNGGNAGQILVKKTANILFSLINYTSMNQILSSASKTVFLLIAIAVIVLTFVGKVDSKDFMTIAFMVFTYYFTRDKGIDNAKSTTVTETDNTPKI